MGYDNQKIAITVIAGIFYKLSWGDILKFWLDKIYSIGDLIYQII